MISGHWGRLRARNMSTAPARRQPHSPPLGPYDRWALEEAEWTPSKHSSTRSRQRRPVVQLSARLACSFREPHARTRALRRGTSCAGSGVVPPDVEAAGRPQHMYVGKIGSPPLYMYARTSRHVVVVRSSWRCRSRNSDGGTRRANCTSRDAHAGNRSRGFRNATQGCRTRSPLQKEASAPRPAPGHKQKPRTSGTSANGSFQLVGVQQDHPT
jgi:hypothetical protein